MRTGSAFCPSPTWPALQLLSCGNYFLFKFMKLSKIPGEEGFYERHFYVDKKNFSLLVNSNYVFCSHRQL